MTSTCLRCSLRMVQDKVVAVNTIAARMPKSQRIADSSEDSTSSAANRCSSSPTCRSTLSTAGRAGRTAASSRQLFASGYYLLPPQASTSSSFYLFEQWHAVRPRRIRTAAPPHTHRHAHAHARVATVCPAVCATHRRSSRCPAAQHCARPIRASRGPTRHPCAGVYAIALPSRRRTSTHWVAAAGVEKARQVPARPGGGV